MVVFKCFINFAIDILSINLLKWNKKKQKEYG